MVQSPLNFSAFTDKLPPHSIETEQALLGGLLIDPNAIGRVADTLRPEAFYIDYHKEIYKAALAIYEKGQTCDLMSVTLWLHERKRLDKVGGQAALCELADCPTSVNVDRYAAVLMDKYYRRQLIEAGHEIAQLAHEDWISQEVLNEQLQEKLLGKKGILHNLKTESQRSFTRHAQLIAAIEKIEYQIENSSLKLWELNQCAKKFGVSVDFVQNCWIRHLVNQTSKRESLADIRKLAGQYIEWLLQGLLPKQGLVLLHAEGGVGKTKLFYDWAFSLVSGEPWNGYFHTTAPKRRILLVQTDETSTEIYSALDARGFTDEHEIEFLRYWNIDNIAGLKREIEDYDPDIILIDSLNSVSQNSLVSENDVEYARPVVALRALSEHLNKCIFLIHHSNRQGDVRGSTAIKASCSIEMKLTRDPNFPQVDATRRILTIGKTRSYRRPAEYCIELDPETGRWTFLGESNQQEAGDPDMSMKERILKHLSEHRNAKYECSDLAQSISASVGAVRRAVGKLANEGLISRIRRGKVNQYFLAWSDTSDPPVFTGSLDGSLDGSLEECPHSKGYSPSDPSDPPKTDLEEKNKINHSSPNDGSLGSDDASNDQIPRDTASDPSSDPQVIQSKLVDHLCQSDVHSGNSSLQTAVAYDSTNPPKVGDRVKGKFAGTVIRVNRKNPKYEIRWDNGSIHKLELEDFELLRIRKQDSKIPVGTWGKVCWVQRGQTSEKIVRIIMPRRNTTYLVEVLEEDLVLTVEELDFHPLIKNELCQRGLSNEHGTWDEETNTWHSRTL